jgi:hypothetical protein
LAEAGIIQRCPNQATDLDQQTVLTHHPLHVFPIDRPLPPTQLGRHAPRPLSRERQRDFLDGRTQVRLVPSLPGIVVGTGRQITQATQKTSLLICRCLTDEATLVRDGQLSSADNFFAAVNSTVS